MGRGKSNSIISMLLLILIITFSSTCFLIDINNVKSQSVISLVAKARDVGNGRYYFEIIKEDLSKIGMDLQIIPLSWSDFISELTTFHDYDLFCIDFTEGSVYDPDLSEFFETSAPENLVGYDPSFDYNESLEIGMNEWYIKKGLEIFPPNSQERIQHYWNWQEYLMERILPYQPLYQRKSYTVNWQNLKGYNSSKGLIKSWGNIFWDGLHQGQNSTDEVIKLDNIFPFEIRFLSNNFVIYDFLFSGSEITNSFMDSLFEIDEDKSFWPHLATNFTMINNTHVRVNLRQNIKWQSDFDGNFTDEYFDAEDVYFTFYTANYYGYFNWIKSLEIIDKYTIDFFIDGNSSTIENDPYIQFLVDLSMKILPEHYLNQSQLADGKTPQLLDIAWEIFNSHPFGTGLFQLEDTMVQDNITMKLFNDSWYLNSSITSSTELNWDQRFGNDYTISSLKFMPFNYYPFTFDDFIYGFYDIVDINFDYNNIEFFLSDDRFTVQFRFYDNMNLIFYNMDKQREFFGDRDPCLTLNSLSKGLALRMAVSYATNRLKIINDFFGIHAIIDNSPLFIKNSIWNNPNVKSYDFNLQYANRMLKYYYGVDYITFSSPRTIIIGRNPLYLVLSFSLSFFIANFIAKYRKRK